MNRHFLRRGVGRGWVGGWGGGVLLPAYTRGVLGTFNCENGCALISFRDTKVGMTILKEQSFRNRNYGRKISPPGTFTAHWHLLSEATSDANILCDPLALDRRYVTYQSSMFVRIRKSARLKA